MAAVRCPPGLDRVLFDSKWRLVVRPGHRRSGAKRAILRRMSKPRPARRPSGLEPGFDAASKSREPKGFAESTEDYICGGTARSVPLRRRNGNAPTDRSD